MAAPKHGAVRDRALGERLRAMRQRWGETQVQFARHFPVGRQAYIGWERFGVPPGSPAYVVRMILVRLGQIARGRKKPLKQAVENDPR
jgi:DNA-binding transcriptional regulator YiaG